MKVSAILYKNFTQSIKFDQMPYEIEFKKNKKGQIVARVYDNNIFSQIEGAKPSRFNRVFTSGYATNQFLYLTVNGYKTFFEISKEDWKTIKAL